MKRRTKIICTIGPVSQSPDMLHRLAQEGMDIARLNFSHGEHAAHQKVIDNIRLVNKKFGKKIGILQDLEGYRIRLGRFEGPIELIKGKMVWMSGRVSKRRDVIPLDSDIDVSKMKHGMHVYIADGTIDLEVLDVSGYAIKLKVLQEGVIQSKKGVNIPGFKLEANIFTQKDKRDLELGLQNKVDFVAQSFVRNRKDIERVMQTVKPVSPYCQVIAKIENEAGVRNIEQIIEACDGIMVARGDLGVSVPVYKVPILQKKIICRTNRKRKLDITATQMLESMIENSRPTRAEVSDVANAVLDGSDCVMLSGETAVGKFPIQTVRMMRQVIEYTERQTAYRGRWRGEKIRI